MYFLSTKTWMKFIIKWKSSGKDDRKSKVDKMATKHPESHSCLNYIVSCAFIVYIRTSIDNESIGLLSQKIPIRQVDKNIIKLWKKKLTDKMWYVVLYSVLRSLLLNGRCMFNNSKRRLDLRKILQYLC